MGREKGRLLRAARCARSCGGAANRHLDARCPPHELSRAVGQGLRHHGARWVWQDESLLNALGGNASHTIVSGRVTLDGRLLTRSMVGYVQQHETLSPSFTVAELVYDACEMSTAKKREECLEIVEAHPRPGRSRCSPGRAVQAPHRRARKLAEMASVVVTQPRVLLVDELTSGLDSAAAIQVTGVLRNLAKFNNTVVIASFDQPSRTVFGMIDELLLLDASRTACLLWQPDQRAKLFRKLRDLGHTF